MQKLSLTAEQRDFLATTLRGVLNLAPEEQPDHATIGQVLTALDGLPVIPETTTGEPDYTDYELSEGAIVYTPTGAVVGEYGSGTVADIMRHLAHHAESL